MRVTSLKGQNTVPTADASTNSLARDVVGNKSDAAVTAVGTVATIIAYIKGVLNQLVALHAVTTADATTDTNMRDTVGRKTDTANETVGDTSSLMRYQKAILTDTGTTIPALHAVPTADVITNTNMRDVVGNKTDALVEDVGTAKTLTAYMKGVIQELAQRDVSVITRVTTPDSNDTYVNVVNITDKGVLTGIQWQVESAKYMSLNIVIDGVAVFNTYVNFAGAEASSPLIGSLPFNHRFDTSLQVQHKVSVGGVDHTTIVTYTTD